MDGEVGDYIRRNIEKANLARLRGGLGQRLPPDHQQHPPHSDARTI